jgi:hypothetical protein
MMAAKEIYEQILSCVCGSKRFRPMRGYIVNTTEIVCAECGRVAQYKGLKTEGK